MDNKFILQQTPNFSNDFSGKYIAFGQYRDSPLPTKDLRIMSTHSISIHLPTPIIQPDFQSHSVTGKIISQRVFFLPLKWWYLRWQNKPNCLSRAVKKLYALQYSSCHHPLCFPRHLANPTGITGCRTEKHNSKISLLPVQQNHAFLSTLHATYFAWRPFFSGIFHEL